MRKQFMFLIFLSLILVSGAFAQSRNENQVTGKLVDSETKESLIGATVSIKGSQKATTTSLNGTFKISVPNSGTTLLISYIGYVSKQIEVSGGKDLGTIELANSSATMGQVTVTAVNPSMVIDRRTPVAATSVNQQYIEEKGQGAEFPELLKGAPGVMTSRTGGGYGDSRVSIRGFNSSNVALLINGIPVNDVEAGKIYWNDWAGLADVTKFMQVQRGLGASTVAAPSLGGTININTLSTETVQGGSISQSIGSFNDLKTTISYSTGLTDKGWSSSFLLSRRSGDGIANGLYYTGYSYFFNLSKVLTKTQTLSFNVMGASQNHGQRYTYNTINTYKNSPDGNRYNSDYGYLNGQLKSAEVNYYNKPLFSINHDWKINEKSSLATVAYASIGVGGASYLTGSNSSLITGAATNAVPRTGDQYSPIDFNTITKNNMANGDGSTSTYIQTAKNDHQQYGVLSSYKRQLTDHIDILAGADLRYYQGEHYYEMTDLLGGQYYTETRATGTSVNTANINNPLAHIRVGDKFNNDYRYDILSEGLYLQSEYHKDKLSAFVALAGNNTGNQRLDYFNYLTTDPARQTKFVNFFGYQAKGGANYNLDSHNNVFANVGYLQRAPLVSNVFLNKKNDINPNAVPEKLFSYELGYGFRSSQFTVNVNLYRSTYKDRSVTPKSVINQDGSISSANLSGLNELHQGIEIDAKFRPVKEITFSGMLSVGDWHYTSDAGPVQVTNDQGSATTTISKIYIKGLKVGDAAQTTAALGMDAQILPQIKVGANFNYYGNYNAYFDPSKITVENYQPWKVPNYTTLDMNIVYRFKFSGLDASFIGNVYNLLGTEYIADAYDSSPTGGLTPTSSIGVFYGATRTYMATFKVKF